MIAEIISVGTELLMGQILNSDAQYLAQMLSSVGINLYHQCTVGDNLPRLKQCIETALVRTDIVLLSGGLGPTEDDLTKWAVAEVLGVEMVEDAASRAHIQSFFERSRRQLTPNNYRQAQFPAGAIIMPNSCGTAPGCICETGEKAIVILPGPPRELQVMVRGQLLPYLQNKSDVRFVSRMLRVVGVGESSVEYALRDLIHEQSNPTIAPYASLAEVSLRVTARVGVGEDASALIDPVVSEICKRLGDAVYSTADESLAQVVARLLERERKTLAVAESLTGGQICEELVSVPGISQYLLEGRVTYTNAAKIRLGVKEESLAKYTAVSEVVACEMARAIREVSGADIGLATTGVAGPGPDENGNPEGLTYIAISTAQGEQTMSMQNAGTRSRLRRVAVLGALNALRANLQEAAGSCILTGVDGQ